MSDYKEFETVNEAIEYCDACGKPVLVVVKSALIWVYPGGHWTIVRSGYCNAEPST